MKTKKQINLLGMLQMCVIFGLMLISFYTFWVNAISIFVEGTRNKEFYPLIAFIVSLAIGAIVGSFNYNKKNSFKENWTVIYIFSALIALILFLLYMSGFTKGNYGFEELQLFLLGCALNVLWHNLSVSFLATLLKRMIK